jgi:type I restriction-modification system DNA methylase subunit
MSLFNHKTLIKNLPKNLNIPDNHLAIINQWKSLIDTKTIHNLNEVEVHASFTNLIMCQLLGYSMVGERSNSYTVAREYKVARGAVDLALGHFVGDKKQDIVLAPFELKGAKTNLDSIMSGRHKTPVQQAFDYARDIRGAKWVLVSNYLEIRLYAVSETSLVYETFFLKDLVAPEQYHRFQLLLNAENFLEGKTEQLLIASEESDTDISIKLYQDYKSLRGNLITFMVRDNPKIEPVDIVSAAQKLLDRILFISFAEDKGLIPNNCIRRAFEHADPFNPKPIFDNFKGLFNAVNKGNSALKIPAYNGGLFAPDAFLDNLYVSDALCEGFSLLADYDFDSDVSVNVLGHIFEQSIADLEKIMESVKSGELPAVVTAKTKSVSGKRKTSGVVYTPETITRFIVENTLGKHLREKFESLFIKFGSYGSKGEVRWGRKKKNELNFWLLWQEELKKIKIVDPAVGSGAFIVASFEYLYPEYQRVNERIIELTDQRTFLDLNKEILNNNLYGVDINAESIEITKLSLWLVTAEVGKPLQTLDENFITGNSLGYEVSAPDSNFVWKDAFKDIFNDGGFDIVLGNPPYVRMEYLKPIKPWLNIHYSVSSDRLDLYGYFFELGINILKPNGRLSYISNATFMKTGSARALRDYITKNVTIEMVVNFGDVQVFEGVTTYPAIYVLNKQTIAESRIEFVDIEDNLPEDLNAYCLKNKQFISQHLLDCKGWELVDESIYNLKRKLLNFPSIKDVYGSPLYGIKTGYNDAFVIGKDIRDRLISEDLNCEKLLCHYYEGKDLKKWHSQPRDLYLINIPKGVINIDEYPSIKNWLLPFKERLEMRATKQEWFELQQAQLAYQPSFKNPKIQYGHFSPEPLFHINIDGAFSNDKSYILPTDDLFIYGLLNSNVYWFLIKSMCPFVRGGYYEVRTQYIETLPVPPKPENDVISSLAKETQSATELRYMIESRFKNRLKDLCPDDVEFKINKALGKWWTLNFNTLAKEIKKSFKGEMRLSERDDWEDLFNQSKQKRNDLDLQVKRNEQALNKAVYNLFDLTQEEAKIVSTNTGR